MIISDYKKIIFIHNPKCAGTTVRNSLSELDSRNDYYWMFDICNNQKIDKAHMPLHIFKQFAPNDFELLKDYFVFGFVRNPYARVISAFNEGHKNLYNKFMSNEINLEAYKLELNIFCNNLTQKNTNGWNVKYGRLVRQNLMFMLGDKMMVDIVIKLEDMEVGIKKLQIIHPELSNIFESWLTKKTKKRPITYSHEVLLDNDTILNIEKVYEKDFILFGYSKLLKK